VVNVSPVADNVHSTNDLADCEKTDNLRGGDTGQSDLLLVGIADAGKDILWGDGGVLEGSRVANSVDQRLKVGLESSRASI
jgi:hypothetical protein